MDKKSISLPRGCWVKQPVLWLDVHRTKQYILRRWYIPFSLPASRKHREERGKMPRRGSLLTCRIQRREDGG
ncbi:hypothetical protein CE91St46_16760 [Eubacteriales bacterium]|nr:hypothetical protein CE91St46_16760 [Eubacteriales bacterium]GKH63287.1 hypothetical protein CE91St47_17560 [Eubacteriales bacterium]